MFSLFKVDELEKTAGSENAQGLAQGGDFCVGQDVVEHERGQDPVKRGIGKGELL